MARLQFFSTSLRKRGYFGFFNNCNIQSLYIIWLDSLLDFVAEILPIRRKTPNNQWIKITGFIRWRQWIWPTAYNTAVSLLDLNEAKFIQLNSLTEPYIWHDFFQRRNRDGYVLRYVSFSHSLKKTRHIYINNYSEIIMNTLVVLL